MSDSIEKARAALEGIDSETLRDMLSLFLAHHPITGVSPAKIHRGRWDEMDELKDFASLVHFLKRSCSIPELRKFSIEDGRVMVDIGSRKIELSDSANGASALPTPIPRAAPALGSSDPNQAAKVNPARFMNLEFDT